jgi:ketosteroid isomerase-like protein
MSAQENVELARQSYDVFARGDIPALLDMYTEDADWIFPPIEGVRHSGNRQGRNGVAEFFRIHAEDEEVLAFTQDTFIAQGNQVAVEGRYEARSRATGRGYGTDFAHLLTISNGKIREIRLYLDTAAVADAHRRGGSARA